MITTNIGQTFILTSVLIDDTTATVSTGKTVYYDIRKQPGDVVTTSGTLTESSVESGIYKDNVVLNEAGNFIAYITCSGFYPSTEDIFVSEEDVSELIKQNRQHNLYVEDVLRTSETPTSDQITRKVALGNTDYVITKIKNDVDLDWSSATEHRTYAWYEADTDSLPYKMGEQS